jgi:NAD(P)H-hydrate epimerase
MTDFNPAFLKKLKLPSSNSHKGQNGKVMVIAGSKLFHAAALWSLKAASHIVDMVYFCSVDENNKIVSTAKKEFRDGIVISRKDIDDYIEEADCVLIGPGLPRTQGKEPGDEDTKILTERFIKTYKHKKWVIDGGSLQTIDPVLIPPRAIITPHLKEFELLFSFPISKLVSEKKTKEIKNLVLSKATRSHCVIVLKGREDIVCSGINEEQCLLVEGGNAGMTKGGTGDVLAGLCAGLYAQNDDPFLVATCASYINKKAGELLYKEKAYWYSTSDLIDAIPRVMKQEILL